MSRHYRQAKILELIEKSPIETQEDLASQLLKAGFKITQATISRDIKELALVKIPFGNRQRYSREADISIMMSKYKEVLRLSLIMTERVDNIVFLHTLQGLGSAVALLIDKLKIEGVVGCVSSDQAVMVLVNGDAGANALNQTIEQIVSD